MAKMSIFSSNMMYLWRHSNDIRENYHDYHVLLAILHPTNIDWSLCGKNFLSYKTCKFGQFLSYFRHFDRIWRHNDDVADQNFG